MAGYVDSEVGRLRTVLLHRPGAELKRLTPRNNDQLLFDGIPWVDRAQEEHDGFAQALRDHGVEVLYLGRAAGAGAGRPGAPGSRPSPPCWTTPGSAPPCARSSRRHLHDLHPVDLAGVLTAGLTQQELKTGRGLTYRLMDEHDFVVDPLPNLLFTRDSSVWIRGEVAVTSPSMMARRREATPAAGDLRVAPPVRRHRDRVRAAVGVAGGRRRAAARPGRARRRHRPADHAGRGGDAGPPGVHRGPGAHRAGGADRAGAGDHAPGHDLHDGRRRRGHALPAGRRHALLPGDRRGRRRDAGRPSRAVPRRRRPGARAGPDPGHRHRPRPGDGRAGAVGRRQQHAVRRARGWPWRTSGTPRPTPSWRRTASR